MVIERLFLPELSKIDENDKKLCAIGVTHLLCDPQPMISGVYFAHLWLPLLQSLLQLFESSNELQTITHAEKKKQAQEEAEEELLVGLDDTPGIYYMIIETKNINNNKQILLLILFKIIHQLFPVWLLQKSLMWIYLIQVYLMLDVIWQNVCKN